jgi:hypothetical protein
VRRVLASAVALAAAASTGWAFAADATPGRVTVLCRITDSRIDESSGVAVGLRSPGILFTHNDSGDSARYFAIDRSCRLLATVNVQGATAVDWEDIARGPGANGKPAVFLGDIGDNNANRSSVTVYEVPEPSVNIEQTGAVISERAVAHRFTYEDGPHNAETLLVEPKTGRIIVVTKADDGDSGVYVAQGAVLHKAGTIDFTHISTGVPLTRSPIAVLGGDLATGGDVAPDGSRVVVRTYAQAFEWTVSGGDVVAALMGAPQPIELPDEQQGEAIAYTRDGKDLVTTSEGKGAPLDLEPAQVAAPAPPTPSTGPTATEQVDHNGNHRGVVYIGIGVVVVGVLAFLLFMRSRGSAGRPRDSR